MEEKRMYHVKIKNEVKEYEAGITYHDIAKEYQKDYEHEIVLVFVDGKLQELHKRLKKDCEISFVTIADSIGHEAYKRSMSFLLVKAVYDVAGHKNIDKVRMHFAIGPGYYCTITGETRVDDDFLERVESRMHELVEADLSIKKRTVHTDEAIGLFGQYGMYDKEELFRYRRVSKVNLYSINEFEDYYYGYMLYSTGYLKYFKLYRYDEGFVLQMPEIDKPEIVPHFQARTKFFQVMKESVKWGDIQEIETVGGLNRNITSGDVQETVLVQEAMQERRIAEIAQMIASRPEIRFVLIAGPSSSGKTTFSHRLSVQLRANGMRPHPIAVDNYFKEREETSQLLFIAEAYIGKPLTPSEIKTILFFTDVLHFSDDLIDYLLQYCVERGKKDFKYIEKVAVNWAEEGITTPKQAQKFSTRYDKNVYSIMNSLGRSTSPTAKELEFINRWTREYGFSTDIILEACERSSLATDRHRFEYAEGILSSWKDAGIHHKADIQQADATYQKKKAT